MIYIAVCDVDNKICSFMEHIIRKYARENAINVEIDIFYSGEALCKSLENSNYYDLICLDIQLQKDVYKRQLPFYEYSPFCQNYRYGLSCTYRKISYGMGRLSFL